MSIPTFHVPVDCTPWVLGGLWPPELNQVSADTAGIAEHLSRDLQRIADSANEKLRAIGDAGLIEPIRQAEENRVVNVARAFAVLRVESTVRHLRREPLGFQREYLNLTAVPDEPTVIVPTETTVVLDRIPAMPTLPAAPEPDGRLEAPAVPSSIPKPQPPMVNFEPSVNRNTLVTSETSIDTAEAPDIRLRQLVDYVARQEPGLRWAAGQRPDGGIVLSTDVAHGWIPSGIDLPDGVELLPPGRRHGNVTTLLGPVEHIATYRPGDPFSGRPPQPPPTPGSGPRRLPEVADLGWVLTEATHWREGLPRLAHTMAKAGAAGTGVLDAELDVLRVHLDTARYQVFAQYPEVNDQTLGNCLLLAASEAIAAGDKTAANYHFSWFVAVNGEPGAGWAQQT